MQLTIQKHVDNAVSKTINLPANATKEDIRKIFIKAWKGGAKGITVYRDRSKQNQPLEVSEDTNPFSNSKCDILGKSCS
jgi:ribonucleoside-diphosphate reductase alpha chain